MRLNYWFLLIGLVVSTWARASQIVNPAASGGGGGGSGGYNLQPSTVVIQAALGVSLPDNVNQSSGAINLSQLSNTGGINGAFNGNFDGWYNGISLASPSAGTFVANQWEMDPAGSFSGNWWVIRVSTVTMNARYALQWHTNGTPNPGVESIVQPVTNYYAYLGSSVTFTIWVNSTIGTTVAIKDSIGTTTSSAHPGDSAWHQLSVTRFIATSASSLTLVLANNTLNGTNNTVYYDGAMLVLGDTPINYTSIPAGIVGVTDGSDATAGNVGEYIFSNVGNTAFPTSVNYGDLRSISLTAGDWDVSGTMVTTTNGSTLSQIELGISTTSGNSGTGLTSAVNDIALLFGVSHTGSFDFITLPPYRISISVPTTVYLKYNATYSVATPAAAGVIRARRMR